MGEEKEYFYSSKFPLYKDPLHYTSCFKEFSGKEDSIKVVFSPGDTALSLIGRYDFITMKDTQEIYIKDVIKGNYHNRGELVIDIELSRFEEANKDKVRLRPETYLAVKREIRTRTFIDRTEFAEHKHPNWINLSNCWFNVLTKKYHFHDKTRREFDDEFSQLSTKETYNLWLDYVKFNEQFLFLTYIPVKYDPNSSCNQFDEFLKEILPDNKDRLTIYEWIGYCLYNGYPIQKALLLIGSGANGKSTLLNIIRKFLGEENVTGTSIYDITYNRFAKAELYTKKANIQSDLPSKLLKDTSLFKMLTGGDLITAEKKNRDPFNFINTAKLFISCNQAFQIDDQDLVYSFFRRWCVIQFPIKIPIEKRKPQDEIINNLTTECELSGILNKALLGLDRLLTNKRFSNADNEEEIKYLWIKLSDPSKWFFSSVVSKGDKDDPGKDYLQPELFNFFNQIVIQESLPEQSEQYFSRCATIFNIEKKRQQKNGVRHIKYLNLHFNNGYSELAHDFFSLSKQDKLYNPNKAFSEIFEKKKPPLLDFIPQIKHYLIMESNNHEDGDINVNRFKSNMISTYKYKEEHLDEILDQLMKEGEIYEPRPGIIRLSN
ncbi:MAG: phage/plasmid primase, P4 family [Candidatus Thorarchaeota archaeon]